MNNLGDVISIISNLETYITNARNNIDDEIIELEEIVPDLNSNEIIERLEKIRNLL